MKQSLRLVLLLLFIFPFSIIHAQTPPTYNSADIYLQLKKLNVLGSVLYIAAHPDDENTRLLAYLSKEKQYRTGYMSLTRGDGGQNLIGDEQGIELGLIRTQELLAARRIDGAEQFFSRAYDFGFCKTAKEAMETWGHDKILSDVVWVIRKFQPDVIITRFPGDERAGHGHHQASSLLANEAFKAAADPNMFPEQFKYGVHPWQAKRILWNTFNFGSVNTTDSTQFKIDVGVYNSLIGKSYGEIASESRSQHKSQGFGVPRQRGQAFEYFLTTGGDAPKNDLMDGVDNTWDRIKASTVHDKINGIISQYNFEYPEYSTAPLVDLYKSIQQLPDSYWKTKKLAEVQQLIIACTGLFAEAASSNEHAVQGDSIHVQFFFNKRNNANVNLKEVQLLSYDSTVGKVLGNNQNLSFTKAFTVPVDAKISQPYWLEKPLQSGSFDVSDQTLIGKAQNDAAYIARFIFTINGVDFSVDRAVQYKFTDPVKGEVYQPLLIVPAITGKFDQPLYVLDGAKQKQVALDLKTKKTFNKVDVKLSAGDQWTVTGGTFNKALQKNTTEETNAVVSKGTAGSITNLSVAINNITDDQNNSYTQPLQEEHSIVYEHIPPILYYKPLTAKVEKIDVVVEGKNIGYIIGAGDKVPQALQQMGYNVTLLNEATITDDNLKKFDAVIAGVRAYNTQDWLYSKYDVLMRYIQNGGNYIVQYNTSNFISSVSNKIGPYPFTVSRTRVTDENAEVKILQPNSTVLNYPNKITQADFNNWIQERSIYQAEQPDSHYKTPLAMHDANEPESNGSLILTKYGKGNFVYTGLVFFRELPAGVPGAYRLMANLIALPQNK
ncbi:PIG-L family deacetylase [Panacibacter ginsenosidivorans]|uniref:PIG-L family deacetylase n=1 Tax=Panacibacter ginsenosidivorans TaxID=1813871 RepID=A0A5B8V8D6_9BACT|nr:PIG-L family deacetylase [Panacibacter ginsenosidivorans]QEC67425.1 PIG-L family deacetylase [Panacibacter ginsenosidivorans]